MIARALRSLGIAALVAGAAPAQAVIVNYTDLPEGTNFVDLGFGTFSSTGGNFQYKEVAGVHGVGVSGQTAGEIDILGENITGTFVNPMHVDWFKLAFLYDGPEFGDVNEVAKITVQFLGEMLTNTYYLTAVGQTTATWTNPAGTVTNLSPAVDPGGGALWNVANPFGAQAIEWIKFEADTGVPGPDCSTRVSVHHPSDCNNQSDYSLKRMKLTPVPEPSTYAMVLAGLGVLGFIVQRRVQQR